MSRAPAAVSLLRRTILPFAVLVVSLLLASVRPALAECAPAPLGDCLAAGQSQLLVVDDPDVAGGGDKIDWKWKRGAAFAHEDLGDPSTSVALELCIYDSSGGQPVLAAELDIAPNAAWREEAPEGWSYDDPMAASDGVRKMRLRALGEGKSSVDLRARGANVEMPAPAAPLFFAQDPVVTVQLVASGTPASVCWTSTFAESSTRRNDTRRFKAVAKAPHLSSRRVFVTSQCYDGNLDGLGGGDQKCQTLAASASLPGTYRAWLADSLDAPLNRFVHGAGPYALIDGTPIAGSWDDLVDGALSAAIDRDENGDPIGEGAGCFDEVWTNVAPDASVAVGDGYEFVCQEWSIALFVRSGPTGRATATDATWTDAGSFGRQTCNRLARLYCFEQ